MMIYSRTSPPLTHLSLEKMAVISQISVQLTIHRIRLDNGLAPARRQAIIWTIDGEFTDAYMLHPTSVNEVFLVFIKTYVKH